MYACMHVCIQALVRMPLLVKIVHRLSVYNQSSCKPTADGKLHVR